MRRTTIALIVVTALLTQLVPIRITISSEAMAEDPLDTAIAPHFSRVVYTLTEPAYSTPCDERGDFKALVGTPGVSNDDSRLVVAPVSSIKSSVVLSTTDVPELNQTRGYYEIGLQVSNTLSWTNISLYDLSKDWINISLHSGAFMYDYDSGTRQLGTFYSPASAESDYVMAFDLTTSSVTLYLYGTNGTLLADKYISNNRLVAGDLDEIRFELQGSTTNVLKVDYLYVMGSSRTPDQTAVSWAPEPLYADDLDEEKRLDLDPTSVTLDQSLRQEVFGFDSVTLGSTITDDELLNALGQTDIHQQRAAGRLVAEGYDDLRESVEDELVDFIAAAQNVESSEVYIIDYYVDYLQCKVKVSTEVVDKVVDQYTSTVATVLEAGGLALDDDSTVTTTAFTLNPTSGVGASSAGGINWSSAKDWLGWPALPLITDALRGLQSFSDPFGIRDNQEYWQGKFDQVYKDITDRADLTLNQTTQLMRDWQTSTEAKYQQVRQDYLNFLSISQAQTAQLASDYREMQDKVERTVSRFYSYTQNQFEATNAIIAKLLLQNEQFSNATTQTSQFFAGQLARTNEVILNLSASITNALSGQDFWSSVYSDGKPASEPLTFSGFFGNNMRTWTIIIVAGLVTVTAVAILLMVFKPGKRSGTKRRF